MARKVNLNLVVAALWGLLVLFGSAEGSDANLVAHWPFDEGSGTVAYDWVGGNDGVFVGEPVWTMGQVGGALDFDGVNDYVDLSSTIQFDNRDFTITGWFRTDSDTSGTHEQIWNSGYDGDGEDVEVVMKNNELVFYARQVGNSYMRQSAGIANDGVWHHFAASRNGNNFHLYLDGVLGSSAYKSLGDLDAAGVIPRIGNGLNRVDYRFFDGSIDDMRIYDRALSAAEVELLYWAGIGGLELAIMQVEEALAEKEAALEGIDVALERELVAYEALEELLESEDYGDLRKGDIIKARQRIHSAMQHQEQSAGALERGVEQLGDALEALGAEPEPEIVYEVSGCGVGPLAAMESDETQFSVVVKGSYIYFEDMVTANCCADEVELQMEVEGNLITIYEIEHKTRSCRCICDYPTTATLGPFQPGTYTVEVYEDYGGFIGSATVTIGPERVKKDAKGLLKVVATSKPKT